MKLFLGNCFSVVGSTLLFNLLLLCSCDTAVQNHPRGTVPYPKTWLIFDDVNGTGTGKNVTIHSDTPSASVKNFNPSMVTYFITRRGEYTHEPIDLKTITADNPDIDVNAMWFFGVHGWTSSHIYSPFYPPIIDAIHWNGGTGNIIHVDWEPAAEGHYLPEGQENCKLSAAVVADDINSLMERGLLKKDKVHTMGYSMGAHFAGFIGKYLYKNHGWKPTRVTAMEPTSLMYEDNPPEERIDAEDGEYVEILHSCGDIMGVWKPYAQVDIYLNTGKSHQPGCSPQDDWYGQCSHSFAVRTYIWYTHLAMKAYKCTSFEDFASGHCNDDINAPCVIGFKYDRCPNGVYHLDTTAYFDG